MDYLLGRLVWEGVATYKELDSWVYSPEQIHDMHRFLDLKEELNNRAMEMYGGDS